MIDYGDRGRLGALIPSGNAVAEPELRAMLPPGLGLVVTRLELRGRSEAELLRMASGIEPAARLLADARPDAIAFHCTAVSTVAPAMATGTRAASRTRPASRHWPQRMPSWPRSRHSVPGVSCW